MARDLVVVISGIVISGGTTAAQRALRVCGCPCCQTSPQRCAHPGSPRRRPYSHAPCDRRELPRTRPALRRALPRNSPNPAARERATNFAAPARRVQIAVAPRIPQPPARAACNHVSAWRTRPDNPPSCARRARRARPQGLLRAKHVADAEPDVDRHAACRAAHAAPPPGRHGMELRQQAHVRRCLRQLPRLLDRGPHPVGRFIDQAFIH